MNPGRLLAALCLVLFSVAAQADSPPEAIVLNDDGAWCWFQDERAIISGSKLLVGSVANGRYDETRTGDVDVVAYDLASGRIQRIELHDQLEPDDHAAPAFWRRPDGNLVAVYSKHGPENCFYVRQTQRPGSIHEWTAASRVVPSDRSRITYSNLHFLSDENGGHGRLYNFFRGFDASFKPSCVWSDDGGASWQTGSVLIDVPLTFRHRPYVKYASNGLDTIHFLYTDGHPRDFDNSLYHAYYRAGRLHRSDGSLIGPLAAGLKCPEDGTSVFRGDAQNVAWVSDVHLAPDGRPYVVFSVQKDSAGLKSGDERAGQDHRYRYAWWDGHAWREHEFAYGGTRLYSGEDDYTGTICLDPDRLNTVYFSTNADPSTGQPLISRIDGRRHYELFRATTSDGGQSWAFSPLTQNSTLDNLRPIVPDSGGNHTVLLWFRGTYQTYRNYQTEVVGLFLNAPQ